MQPDISRTVSGGKKWHVKFSGFVVKAQVFTTDTEVVAHVPDVVVGQFSADFAGAIAKVSDFGMIEDKGFRRNFNVCVFHFIGHTRDGDASLGMTSLPAFEVDGAEPSIYAAVTGGTA